MGERDKITECKEKMKNMEKSIAISQLTLNGSLNTGSPKGFSSKPDILRVV